MKPNNDELIKLIISEPKISIRRWPDKILAPRRKPKDIALDEYDNASIRTNTGTRGKGVPLGTNRPKNPHPCKYNPNITLPNHNAKLNDTIATNCADIANEYGIIDIRLAINIKLNIVNINGKYTPPARPIWLITKLCIVSYIDTIATDHLVPFNVLWPMILLYPTINDITTIRYKVKLVNDNVK